MVSVCVQFSQRFIAADMYRYIGANGILMSKKIDMLLIANIFQFSRCHFRDMSLFVCVCLNAPRKERRKRENHTINVLRATVMQKIYLSKHLGVHNSAFENNQ